MQQWFLRFYPEKPERFRECPIAGDVGVFSARGPLYLLLANVRVTWISQPDLGHTLTLPIDEFPPRKLQENEMSRMTPLVALPVMLFGMVSVGMLPAVVAEDKAPANQEKKVAPALNFKMKSLDGKPVNLTDYQGKVVLIVNVASECSLTPQYEALQGLYEKLSPKGLVVLGVPCNQFGGQEPGTAKEISTFCTENYGVTFPLLEKVAVNGDDACDLYKHLTSLDTKPKGSGKIGWNFEKFLIGRDGSVAARFEPRTAPDAAEVVKSIQAELAKK